MSIPDTVTSTRVKARLLGSTSTARTSVEETIKELETADIGRVRIWWWRVLGKEPSDELSREFMARYLAYRIQARAIGDLDGRHRQVLNKIAAGDDSAISVFRERRFHLQPGTFLIREYKGELHKVMVMEKGFAWNGKTFGTLSAVAAAITGVHWNGYKFFGLRQKSEAKAPVSDV